MRVSTAAPRVHRAGFHATTLVLSSSEWAFHVYERHHNPYRASLALLCDTAAEAMGNLSCTCAGAITPLAATLSAGGTDEFKHAAAEVAEVRAGLVELEQQRG